MVGGTTAKTEGFIQHSGRDRLESIVAEGMAG